VVVEIVKRSDLTRYRRVGALGDGGQPAARLRSSARAVAWDREGRWYLAGDQEILVFDEAGGLLHRWPTGQPAWSLSVDPEGRVWAGGEEQIEVLDQTGQRQDLWNDPALGFVTALAVTAEDVFVADARARWIHRFDDSRSLVNHIGDKHRKGGFHIPNGVLDFAVDVDGTVVVANPGMHRVERYRADGESLGYFGRFGQQDPRGFPGCCNPTNLALAPNGDVVVSEKAGPRVKVYSAEGDLRAVVAAGEDFDPACKNMDLAVSATGTIGVVDPVQRMIVLFEPEADAAATGGQEALGP
jgi:hypothetical protein